jgi:beta-fructofuranosidase
VFVPDQPYDCKGIFTGCFHPAGPAGEKGDLSVFYTSVKHLPISWDIPYTRGCEGLAMATSKDGGKTCEFCGW